VFLSYLIIFKSLLGSYYGVKWQGREGKAATKRTCPNDARHVIWAIGETLLYFFVFLSYLIFLKSLLGSYYGVKRRGRKEKAVTKRTGPFTHALYASRVDTQKDSSIIWYHCSRHWVVYKKICNRTSKKTLGHPLEGGQVLHYILISLPITLLAKKVSEQRWAASLFFGWWFRWVKQNWFQLKLATNPVWIAHWTMLLLKGRDFSHAFVPVSVFSLISVTVNKLVGLKT
jgi:hypothetical protein